MNDKLRDITDGIIESNRWLSDFVGHRLKLTASPLAGAVIDR
jgi:hypothetical protein